MGNQMDNQSVQPAPTRKRRSCLGCLGRGLIILAGLLVLVLLAGAIYQAAASASDLKKYPPPGQLYSVGDHRLHLYCAGEGSPTVILEAGAGSPGLIWTLVQEEVASSTRVCSYDRAGFGWSDPAAEPLSPEQGAQDLHTLLQAAGIPGPYILVGHSAGGVYVRIYARLYPSEVIGMVLVDSSSEGQSIRYPPEYQELNSINNSMTTFCQIASPFGVMRISRIFDIMTAGATLEPQKGAAILSTLYRTRFCRVSADEIEALSALLSQEDEPGSLGDLPLIVLTAESSEEELQAQIPAYLQASVGPDVIAKVFEANREMQEELVGLSSQGKQIMVQNTGHIIQLDQPGVVIDAILEILRQVRDQP